MKKIIKKWGSGLGIFLNKEESIILNLNVGDIIEIEIERGDEKNIGKKEKKRFARTNNAAKRRRS